MRSELRAKRRLHNPARRDKLFDFSIHGRTSSSWPYRLRSVAHTRNSVEPAIANADLAAAGMMLSSARTMNGQHHRDARARGRIQGAMKHTGRRLAAMGR